jgi:CHAT domain-containing protein
MHTNSAAQLVLLKLFVGSLTILVLSACQSSKPKTISSEAAVQAVASFKQTAYKPTRRNVLDIADHFDASNSPYDSCNDAHISLTTEESIKLAQIQPVRSSKENVHQRWVFSLQAHRSFLMGEVERALTLAKLARASDSGWRDDISSDELDNERAVFHAAVGRIQIAEDLAGGFLPSNHRNRIAAYRRARAFGAIAFAKGQPQQAADHFREAIAAIESGKARRKNRGGVVVPHYELLDIARSELARALTEMEQYDEAEGILRAALDTRGQITEIISMDSAYVLFALAELSFRRDRLNESEALAKSVLSLYDKLCVRQDSFTQAKTHDLLGRVYQAQGKSAEALKELETIRTALVERSGLFERKFANGLHWALAFANTGQKAPARKILSARREEAVKLSGSDSYTVTELDAFSAMTSDQHSQVLASYNRLIPKLLDSSGQTQTQDIRRASRHQRLDMLLEDYLSRLAESAGADNAQVTETTFRISQFMGRGQTADDFREAAARGRIKDPELTTLVRAEQDARRKHAMVLRSLAALRSEPFNNRDPEAQRQLNKLAGSLDTAQRSLRVDILSRFPDYSKSLAANVVPLDQVRTALKPGETMVIFHVGERETMVWAAPANGTTLYRKLNLPSTTLAKRVDALREAVDTEIGSLNDIPEFDLKGAHALYRDLFSPVEAALTVADNLVVIANGPLGRLPLSMLVNAQTTAEDGALMFDKYRTVPWLARKYSISYTPSVEAFMASASQSAAIRPSRAFTGYGDPWFNSYQASQAKKPAAASEVASRGGKVTLRFAQVRGTGQGSLDDSSSDTAKVSYLARLPATASEVMAIAKTLDADPANDIALGDKATETAIKRAKLDSYRVILFATHGLVPGDLPGLDEPALAFTPAKVGGGSDDGLLKMSEVMDLKLNADWVVLSACNTAAGEGEGAEAVSGLGRAFFYAGARALLVSNWPVHSGATTELTTTLFREQRAKSGLTRANALQRARNHLIDNAGYQHQGKPLFSYAHPIFWAPFTLIGDGRG